MTTRPTTGTGGPTIRTLTLTAGGRTMTAQLNDSTTAQDLASQLPLTLSLRDFQGVEKGADLPRPLTMEGVPRGADPEPNDLGYYAPGSALVLYYADVGYFDGIVRLGRLDPADMAVVRELPDGTEIVIDRG